MKNIENKTHSLYEGPRCSGREVPASRSGEDRPGRGLRDLHRPGSQEADRSRRARGPRRRAGPAGGGEPGSGAVHAATHGQVVEHDDVAEGGSWSPRRTGALSITCRRPAEGALSPGPRSDSQDDGFGSWPPGNPSGGTGFSSGSRSLGLAGVVEKRPGIQHDVDPWRRASQDGQGGRHPNREEPRHRNAEQVLNPPRGPAASRPPVRPSPRAEG